MVGNLEQAQLGLQSHNGGFYAMDLLVQNLFLTPMHNQKIRNYIVSQNKTKKDTKLLVEAITGLLKVTSFTLKPKNFLNNFDYLF